MRYEIVKPWPDSDLSELLRARCIVLAGALEMNGRLLHSSGSAEETALLLARRGVLSACWQIDHARLEDLTSEGKLN